LLIGDDKMAVEHYIATLVARMGDPGMAELNISRLDGKLASDEDIRTAAFAMPFLAERRLVILTNPLGRLNNPASQGRFIQMLDSLPQTTALVLVIEDHHKYNGWEHIKTDHWLMKWVADAGTRVLTRPCPLPDAQEMPGWITNQAKIAGGKFTPQAAAVLAEHTGNNTALATQEIDKLLMYVDGQRPVDENDVMLLVETGGPVDVFKMAGALAERNGKKASGLLHALLAEGDPRGLFALIVRQFRILVQIREILDEGGSVDQVRHEIKPLAYANQYVQQARGFTQAELDAIYHRLLQLDESIKTSQLTDELAMELLVTEITR
jgi:DNA polymerase-3 subunit delta